MVKELSVTQSSTYVNISSLAAREGNYQNIVISGIEFFDRCLPNSFEKSDFRGAHLRKCKFIKQNFDRSDFNGAIIEDCEFIDCSFGNYGLCTSIVKRTSFVRCDHNSSEISRTSFKSCHFDKVNFFSVTAFDLTFDKTSFRNCIFERAGFENIDFSSCTIENSNLSDMTPFNFSFIGCVISKVNFSLDYYPSYLMHDCKCKEVSYDYLYGSHTYQNVDIEVYESLYKYLFNNKRFFELFRLQFLTEHKISDEKRFKIFSLSINAVIDFSNTRVKHQQLDLLIKTISFYYENSLLSDGFLLKAVTLLKSFLLNTELSFHENYFFKERAMFLSDLLLWKEPKGLTNSSFTEDLVILKITFDDEKNSSLSSLESVFSVLMPRSKNSSYKILNVYNGSTIIELVTYIALGLFICRAVKSLHGNICDIIVEHKVTKKTLTLLDRVESAKELASLNAIRLKNIESNTQAANELSKQLQLVKKAELSSYDVT